MLIIILIHSIYNSEIFILRNPLVDEIHDLTDLFAGVSFGLAVHSVFDTVLKVPFEDAFFDRPQGAFDRGDLVEDINAVLLVLDHPLDSPYLALDPPQGGKRT